MAVAAHLVHQTRASLTLGSWYHGWARGCAVGVDGEADDSGVVVWQRGFKLMNNSSMPTVAVSFIIYSRYSNAALWSIYAKVELRVALQ